MRTEEQLEALRRLRPLGPLGEHLIENVKLPSGLQRAHVTGLYAEPQLADWQHLVPAGATLSGVWGYTDSQKVFHLVMTWKEMEGTP